MQGEESEEDVGEEEAGESQSDGGSFLSKVGQGGTCRRERGRKGEREREREEEGGR